MAKREQSAAQVAARETNLRKAQAKLAEKLAAEAAGEPPASGSGKRKHKTGADDEPPTYRAGRKGKDGKRKPARRRTSKSEAAEPPADPPPRRGSSGGFFSGLRDGLGV